MARAYVFQGHVDEHGALVIGDPIRWRAVLLRMKTLDVELRIERQPEDHSLRQLRYLWGRVYKMLAEFSDDSVERIHGVCTDRFLREVVVTKLGEYVRIKRVSELTMSELHEYTEQVRRLGADMGCNIPAANEPCEVTL